MDGVLHGVGIHKTYGNGGGMSNGRYVKYEADIINQPKVRLLDKYTSMDIGNGNDHKE